MVVAKDMTIEELFSKEVERFGVADGQLNLLTGAPDVRTTTTVITAYYAPKIGTVRLYVGSKEGGWRAPQSLDEPSRYNAIKLALDDFDDAVVGLLGYETRDRAIAAWKGDGDARRMQRMGEEFDVPDSDAAAEDDDGAR